MSAGKLADEGLSEKGQAILWGTSLAGIGGMAAATVAMNYHDIKQRKAEEKLGVSEFERRILSLYAQRGGLNNG